MKDPQEEEEEEIKAEVIESDNGSIKMQEGSKSKLEDKCTTFLFCLFLGLMACLSAANCLHPQETISTSEKRQLANFPALDTNFSTHFNSFYNDHLAFREDFIRWLNVGRYYAFGVSPSDKVLVGKNGWLYFLNEGDRKNLIHSPLLPQAEIANWVRHLQAKERWLAQRHSRYLLVLPPSKCEIERDGVPEKYQYKNALSNQDLLIAALRKTGIDILDIRPTMREFKKENEKLGPLYLKTDTHWNALGGFIGYQAIAGHLAKVFSNSQIKPMTLADFNLSQRPFADGDLVKMMGLKSLIKEAIPKLQEKIPYLWCYSNNPPKPDFHKLEEHTRPFATERSQGGLPSAVFIRDSFLRVPQPMLSQHFRRAYYFWSKEFPIEIIKEEKPDIVIEEFVERDLVHPPPALPEEVEKFQNTAKPKIGLTVNGEISLTGETRATNFRLTSNKMAKQSIFAKTSSSFATTLNSSNNYRASP